MTYQKTNCVNNIWTTITNFIKESVSYTCFWDQYDYD